MKNFEDKLFETINHIPWWVWLILLFLLSSKP